MTELKCPVCNTVLDRAILTDKVCGCPKCRNVGNVGLWELLADTKKKLDIAVKALKVYSSESGNWWYRYEFQGNYKDYAGEYADDALEQITALEQKD